jgi:hypothetical protein
MSESRAESVGRRQPGEGPGSEGDQTAHRGGPPGHRQPAGRLPGGPGLAPHDVLLADARHGPVEDDRAGADAAHRRRQQVRRRRLHPPRQRCRPLPPPPPGRKAREYEIRRIKKSIFLGRHEGGIEGGLNCDAMGLRALRAMRAAFEGGIKNLF